MYFIIKGECVVLLRDFEGKQHMIRMIHEGHQFGEIGLIYNRTRTASVLTKNYAILARISKTNFREMISEQPIFSKILSHQVFQYKDPNIRFMKQALSQIPFIKSCKVDALYCLLFAFQSKFFDLNEIIL